MPFSLLDLPPELWKYILNLVVTAEGPIILNAISGNSTSWRLIKPSTYHNEFSRSRDMVQQPALTRVCRLLREEGLRVYYGANVFYCWSFGAETWKLRDWLVNIGPRNRRLVKVVYFNSRRVLIERKDKGKKGECELPEGEEVVVGEGEMEMLRSFGYGDENTGGEVRSVLLCS